MGLESFQVTLFNGSTAAQTVINAVRERPGVVPDMDSISLPGSNYFLMRDSKHVIEIEVTNNPVTVSCRFTLCHPPTVDAVFLHLIVGLMTQLEMYVQFADDSDPNSQNVYSLESLAEFRIALQSAIAARRVEWRSVFGSQQFAAQTNEVHERVILAQCVTSIETAG